ncbi:Trk system potassium transporter TrkA [Enterococcus dongliensis]|uniref:Trk system potassium uptake protein TrkA n=1 Tax=Enterococcus dongliensis TaxID=2559925 RepID=A0AAP5KNH2_9ENTE|nr:Trk system potassium transporter TrkA [Enterococcus dongliensis]MDT2595531.1 Trk system potassium transporter TrkA [Enterococcus dongliensis]MDT2633616.1 Trk system potassium transporter TrkA [Enterococcus dongliensis]MDT2636010.1 Trk system potassium transporter TrkA [Enterococcus dongliensis]MDT2641787.1 Trk system potassium transporter TrkA [Enterococcus dongliensis]MDT2646342.1 Trk system potassium transporter TrkA [Enterococcus dongliensis]
MKIIVLGAGKVGKALTQYLSNEEYDYDVVVVDLHAEKVEAIVNQFDVLGVVGDGATYDILLEAGVNKTDIIIAVTQSDELNILACLMAKKMGAQNSIARVRNPEYLKQRSFMRDQLGLSMIINPELEAANEIRRILLFPSAFKVDTFVSGKIELAEFRLKENARLIGVSLNRLDKVSKANVLICAIRRKGELLIPDGNVVLEQGDRIHVMGQHRDLVRFCQDINLFEQKTKRIIIVGGGRIAYYLAHQLIEHGIQVKIIENNPKRCVELSIMLPKATIIESDGSDEEVLIEEGIESVDAFVALTGLDEENIVISLYAKQMKAKKTVAKVTRTNFMNVLDQLDIDSVVSPKNIIATHILRYVRAKNNKDDDSSVKTLHHLFNDDVDAMEFVVTPQTCFLNQKVSDVKLKNNILIAAISRERGFVIPKGDTEIRLKDHIVVITTDRKISSLNDLVRR